MQRRKKLLDELAEPLAHPGAEELHAWQEQVARWSLQHFTSIAEQSPGQTASRKELENRLGQALPEAATDFDKVFAEFCDKIAPLTFRVNHPRFLAFVPCAPSYPSILGDWLCSSLNCFAGVWFEAPAAAQIEIVVLDLIKETIGYPATAKGILTSGGSEANLTALVVARERLAYGDRSRALLYQSAQRHWSVDRAAKVVGLRPDQLRLIPTDADYRLDVGALAKSVREDRASGHFPWAVVANAGTTNTGAVDPLVELSEFCRQENVWLHVDGAYGWAAVLSPVGRKQLAGLERADSITLDPHKWFAQTFEAGCLLVRQGKLLPETFASLPEYMQDVAPTEEEINFADHGLALTRRFRGLKIWFSLRILGLSWFREMVNRCLGLAELIELLLLETGKFEMLAPRGLSVVCFRYRPPKYRGEGEKGEQYLDELNSSIQKTLWQTGRAFLTTTQLNGRIALRCCFVNWRTTAGDVQEVVKLVTEIGDRLAASS